MKCFSNSLDFFAVAPFPARLPFDSSLANHKLSYISKCISVIYALDSVNEKIGVRTEADLLPFYQLDKTVQSTRIQICRS